jgi:hypothetical protein
MPGRGPEPHTHIWVKNLYFIKQIHHSMKPLISVPRFDIYLTFYVEFQWSQVHSFSHKFPPFKIFISLGFKSSVVTREI